MKLLIKGARVIDPAGRLDKAADILIDGSRIVKLEKNITGTADEVIDARDKIVMPGIVDMHVHLREPGREDKETIYSGTRAALKGGVTSVLAMPNTLPAIDSLDNIKLLKNIIRKSAQANVFVCAAITKGRQGKELTKIAGFKKEGVRAISDDGASVDDAKLMLGALKQAAKQKITVICHSEDKRLSNHGAVNLGVVSTRMGLKGISSESEYKRVERDLRLAKEAGVPVHIAHLSCRESVELIARAKKKGVRVTAETAPHYFALSEEAVLGYDTNLKMNPPLRSKEDVEAIKAGLKDGTIDAIASDHAPHTENEKEIEFERAEFGVVGLETMLSVAITELVGKGLLDWLGLAEKLMLNPARILGLDKGALRAGKDADLIVVAPDREWQVEKETLISLSRNSAFLGRKLKGLVEYTILNGRIAYKA